MSFSINEFKAQLVGGGARPTLFRAFITNPITAAADLKSPFMIKAASLPASTTGSYVAKYFGRDVKFGGDRTYEDWTVTVINDEDFLVRNAMEAWNNAINTHAGNLRALPRDYKSQAQMIQYSKDQSVLKEYTFDGIFPINISAIETSWDTVDTIEEFQVTFQYDEYRITGGSTGNPLT
jgi:hypothetical protein